MKSSLDPIIIENILESLPSGLMVIGPEGNILYANDEVEHILGYKPQEIMAKGWGELFFIDDRKNLEFNQVIIDVIYNESLKLRHSVPYDTPNNERRYLNIISSFLKQGEAGDQNGEMKGITLLFKDVTQVHQLQEQEKAILRQNMTLNRERMEGLNQLAMSVAHQIRNPVTSIAGFANLLLKRCEEHGEEREFLTVLLQESRRLEEVVKAVAEFSSFAPARRKRIELTPLLHQAKARLEEKAVAQGKSIAWEDAFSSRVYVTADPELLSLALDEILENSLDFCREETVRITVTPDKKDQTSSIVIHDQSGHIDARDLPFVFDPFFTTKAVGVGMGLAKAKRAVIEHQGEIHIRNAPKQGVELRISLPDTVTSRGGV